MPPNNSNSTSSLTRQMHHLRRKVDRIDLKILQLLQQRIKLSLRIGQVKRRHGAPVYVPQREGELRTRVAALCKGKLPPQSVDAIFREIMSNSRAAQGQAPLGLLRSSADVVMAPARWQFGACDDFVVKKTWPELAAGIQAGALTLGLLTGEDLALILKSSAARKPFLTRFEIVGDFTPGLENGMPLARRIFIVTPRNQGVAGLVNHVMILIECKSTVNTVKKLANSMPYRSICVEDLSIRKPSIAVVRLTLPKRTDTERLMGHLLAAGKSLDMQISLLGVYSGTENYGG